MWEHKYEGENKYSVSVPKFLSSYLLFFIILTTLMYLSLIYYFMVRMIRRIKEEENLGAFATLTLRIQLISFLFFINIFYLIGPTL